MVGVLIVAAVVTFAVLCLVIAANVDRRNFADRFPPISADEFMARCSPGTSRHVALTVRRIVAKHLAVEYERIHPSMRFVEDIGAD